MFKTRFIIPLLVFCLHLSAEQTPSAKPLLSPQEISTIEWGADQWINRYCTLMTPSQLQVVINMIYFLYAGSILEAPIKRAAVMAPRIAQAIRKKINKYDRSNIELAVLKALANKLLQYDTVNHDITLTLRVCETYLEQHEQSGELTGVMSALEGMKSHGQEALCTYANTHQKDITVGLKRSQQAHYSASQFFLIAGNTFAGLCSKMPLPCGSTQRELQRIDIATNIANQSTDYALDVIESSNSLSDHLIALTQVSKVVYAAYYNALYRFMATHIDKKFMTIMFDATGIIEERLLAQLLPNPTLLDTNTRNISLLIATIQNQERNTDA